MAPNVFIRNEIAVSKGTGKQAFIENVGATLAPGEFVQYDGFNSVARIIDVEHTRDRIPNVERPHDGKEGCFILLQCYQQPDDSDSDIQSKNTPLDPVEYKYVTDVTEVVATEFLEWVHADRVSGIAFVFHVDEIKDQVVQCNGISNSRFFRRRLNHATQELVNVNKGDHVPFPRNTYSSRIWRFLNAVICECRKALSGSRQWPKRQKTIHIPNINEECWGYVSTRMKAEPSTQFPLYTDSVEHPSTRDISRKTLLPGLEQKVISEKVQFNFIRVLGSHELARVRHTFGSTFAVGVKKPCASKGSRPVALHDNDLVGLVVCNVETPEQNFNGLRGGRFRARVGNLGTDFLYCEAQGRFTVVLRFDLVKAGVEAVSNLSIRFKRGSRSRPQEGVLTITENMSFIIPNDGRYKVISVDGDDVSCMKTSTHVSHTFSRGEVTSWILDSVHGVGGNSTG